MGIEPRRRTEMASKRHTPEEILAKLLPEWTCSRHKGRQWLMRCAPSASRRWIIIESWRRHDNAVRPHASLGYSPPAPEVFIPAFTAWPATQAGSASPATLKLATRPPLN